MAEVIGIFGGSFNPVHNGHVALARYLSDSPYLDKVWLTLSPQNPLKKAQSLTDDHHRLEMLKLATEVTEKVEVCDIELTMPRPSYTINTLDELAKRHPQHSFKLVIGADNWAIFDQWKDFHRIINDYGVVIYPRPGYALSSINDPNVKIVNAPLFDVSSTHIRTAIALGNNPSQLLPTSVWNYIVTNNLYK